MRNILTYREQVQQGSVVLMRESEGMDGNTGKTVPRVERAAKWTRD
jgi:hypothetical protein